MIEYRRAARADIDAFLKIRMEFVTNICCSNNSPQFCPDTAKEKPLKGTVIAVGKGTKDEEMVLQEGHEVLYGKYSGTEVELEGEKYLIMHQKDVLAILG